MFELLAAAAAGTPAEPPAWMTSLPIIGMVGIFWFLVLAPQMRRTKEHRQRIDAIKKGDQVVTQGGIVGKVIKVDDTYAEIEIAPNVKVKTVKHTIADLIEPGGKPAND